jgi:hypothetical protein
MLRLIYKHTIIFERCFNYFEYLNKKFNNVFEVLQYLIIMATMVNKVGV